MSIHRKILPFYELRNDVFMMAIMIRSVTILACLQVTLVFTLRAQQLDSVETNNGGWHKIGEVTADFLGQNESSVTFNAEKYRAIKFKVTDAPITFEMGTIYYGNGEVEQLLINREMGKDQETRPFGLRRPPENLSKISFKYKMMPHYRHEAAHVEIFGLK